MGKDSKAFYAVEKRFYKSGEAQAHRTAHRFESAEERDRWLSHATRSRKCHVFDDGVVFADLVREPALFASDQQACDALGLVCGVVAHSVMPAAR